MLYLLSRIATTVVLVALLASCHSLDWRKGPVSTSSLMAAKSKKLANENVVVITSSQLDDIIEFERKRLNPSYRSNQQISSYNPSIKPISSSREYAFLPVITKTNPSDEDLELTSQVRRYNELIRLHRIINRESADGVTVAILHRHEVKIPINELEALHQSSYGSNQPSTNGLLQTPFLGLVTDEKNEDKVSSPTRKSGKNK